LLSLQQAQSGFSLKVAEKLGEEEWFYRKTTNLNVANSKIAVNLQNLARIV
jgi:hypothetical protein